MAKNNRAKNSEKPQTESPQKTDDFVRANINRELIPAVNAISLYANDTQLQVSPWDFRFMFGVIAGLPSPDRMSIQVQQVGEVRMSPQHAKKVAQVLIQQIQLYEKTFGLIPNIE
jgi:hypothetical protein